ncbi:hypothetical protein CsSME_00024086 [Camellia sinensis var. sinensis]
MELSESPECPVCLQPYDGDSTTPRVLACGHSACQTCLKLLPQPFPHTICCPACTQLVKYPHPQGPSALPKNIDLLCLASPLFSNAQIIKIPKTLQNQSKNSQFRSILYPICGLMSFIWHRRTGLFPRT